jgi:hypothetical protein
MLREEALRRSASVAAIILLALAVAAASFWIFFAGSDRSPAPPPALRADSKGNDRAARSQGVVAHEEWQARADHRNVAEAVAACSGIGNLARQPPAVLEALRVRSPAERNRLPLGESTTVGLGKDAAAREQDSSASPLLSNYARAAIYLSDSIRRLRIEAAYAATSSDWRMNIFQWAIVIIGAVTTILISVKSIMSSDEALRKYSRWIGFFAIFFFSAWYGNFRVEFILRLARGLFQSRAVAGDASPASIGYRHSVRQHEGVSVLRPQQDGRSCRQANPALEKQTRPDRDCFRFRKCGTFGRRWRGPTPRSRRTVSQVSVSPHAHVAEMN